MEVIVAYLFCRYRHAWCIVLEYLAFCLYLCLYLCLYIVCFLPSTEFSYDLFTGKISADDSCAERNALHMAWPNSQLLLCAFHFLQKEIGRGYMMVQTASTMLIAKF